MNISPEALQELTIERIALIGYHPVRFPKRVLELTGHRAMQQLAGDLGNRAGIQDLEITSDDVGDWSASFTVGHTEYDLFLQQEVLSAEVRNSSSLAATSDLLASFGRNTLPALGSKYIRQLAIQFEHSWTVQQPSDAVSILRGRVIGDWDRSSFSVLAHAVEGAAKFGGQFHWALELGEAVASISIPMEPGARTLSTALGIQLPGIYTIEEKPDPLRDFLEQGLRAFQGGYSAFLEHAFRGVDLDLGAES